MVRQSKAESEERIVEEFREAVKKGPIELAMHLRNPQEEVSPEDRKKQALTRMALQETDLEDGKNVLMLAAATGHGSSFESLAHTIKNKVNSMNLFFQLRDCYTCKTMSSHSFVAIRRTRV